MWLGEQQVFIKKEEKLCTYLKSISLHDQWYVKREDK